MTKLQKHPRLDEAEQKEEGVPSSKHALQKIGVCDRRESIVPLLRIAFSVFQVT